jgi:uncharacterized protein (DUF736 family)
MTEYDDELRGVMFPETEKKSERGPDFTGKLQVEGKEYRIAAWKRKARSSGKPFLSLLLEEQVEMEAEDIDPEGALDL